MPQKERKKNFFKYNSQKYDEAAKDQNLFILYSFSNYFEAHKIKHLGVLTENKKINKTPCFHPTYIQFCNKPMETYMPITSINEKSE